MCWYKGIVITWCKGGRVHGGRGRQTTNSVGSVVYWKCLQKGSRCTGWVYLWVYHILRSSPCRDMEVYSNVWIGCQYFRFVPTPLRETLYSPAWCTCTDISLVVYVSTPESKYGYIFDFQERESSKWLSPLHVSCICPNLQSRCGG